MSKRSLPCFFCLCHQSTGLLFESLSLSLFQVCVRGLMHIVKWMEGLEKHGSDPHLLSISSSRDASLARRKGKRHSTTSRSFIDNSQAGAGENG